MQFWGLTFFSDMHVESSISSLRCSLATCREFVPGVQRDGEREQHGLHAGAEVGGRVTPRRATAIGRRRNSKKTDFCDWLGARSGATSADTY